LESPLQCSVYMEAVKKSKRSHRLVRALTHALLLFFIVILLSSPNRFAYAADAPQTPQNFLTSVTTVLRSLASGPPPAAPVNTLHGRIILNDSDGTPVGTAIVVAAHRAAATVTAAVQVAKKSLSHFLSQSASAFGDWVALANSDILSPVRKATVPPTQSVRVFQTGANAPPVRATLSTISALPTTHLFRTAGASPGQPKHISFAGEATSTSTVAGLVLGASTPSNGYITQDQLTTQLQLARIMHEA
jgi:hypothetical protein